MGGMRQRRRTLLWLATAVACVGCRKPPPDEIVYTGAEARPITGPGAGGASSTGGGSPPPPAGGAGAGGEPAAPPPGDDGQSACSAPAASDAPFSRAGLIAAAADCAVWHYCVFEEQAVALEGALSALVTAPSAESEASAQEAFFAALSAWQRAELFRFGPAARSTEPGGQDLRDLIYAWPVGPECKVDEQTVSQSYRAPAFHSLDFVASPVSGRTLNALEYLLFARTFTNGCSQFNPINADGTWAALSRDEITSRRREYALEVARDVSTRSRALLDAWSPSGGNFRAVFTGSGPGNTTFPSEQAVLNAVSNALFYLDVELKDVKLATPLGLTPECTAAACPNAVESTYTDRSLAYVRENVIGFRRLFEGCGEGFAGLGFDDWLRDVGASDLADRMTADLRAIDGVIDAVPGSLSEAVVSNRDAALAVHTAVKAVTDELKTEMVTVLNLELPAASEGDND